MRKRIVIKELGDPITIEQAAADPGALGHLDEGSGRIIIDPSLPEAGKHIVLLHEFLHLVDYQMVQTGITKRRADHRWIESAAPNLLALLVLSGMYSGIDRKTLIEFMTRMDEPRREERG